MAIPRKLTQHDVSHLKEVILLWHELFGTKLERWQLVEWAEQVRSYDQLRYAITVSKGWFERKDEKPPEREIYRYCTGIIKHVVAAAEKADKLLGVEL